jgi:hypothetical protein
LIKPSVLGNAQQVFKAVLGINGMFFLVCRIDDSRLSDPNSKRG